MTRIGLISDIHVDLNTLGGEEVITGFLAAESRRRGLDILLVAGDLAGDYAVSLKTVDRLSAESGARVLFIPGNHDIWNEKHPGLKAWDTYNALLAHPANLARGPVFIEDGWTIVGDLGWYDFAFGDPSFTIEDFERMSYMDRTWQDKIMSIWDRGTLEVHRMFMDRLGQALDAAAGGRILLATHVVQVSEFTVQNPGAMWKYFNAFLGSPEYGELAIKRGVALSVCGHVHHRCRVSKGGTKFVCPCLGYRTEWPARDGRPADAAREIARTLAVYELGENEAIPVPDESASAAS
ncbi:MAG: metallophosphoesterase [Spirochaetes bacterium]|nr:metallophosphoesterase [Spirochaetota bacterium]